MTPDPTPTRDGVTIVPGVHVGRDDVITLPGKGGKLRSDRRWRMAYDADPVIVWSATPRGLARGRYAGPASAAAAIRTDVHDDERYPERRGPRAIAAFWESEDPINRFGHGSREDIALRTGLTEIVKGLVARRTTAIPSTGSTGGSMASIEEVRGGIAQACDKANESLGAQQQALSDLEQAQGLLTQTTEGSSQADVTEANNLLAKAINDINEVQQTTMAAVQAAEGVAARL